MKKETILKCLPLAAMALIIVFFGAAISQISIADILNLAPKSFLLAALLVWGLYLLKSVSVVFPLMVLYISVGAIFPVVPALAVSAVGLLICITVPFFIGRFSGTEAVSKLTEKYPKAKKISDFSSDNAVFTSYILRIINLLPGDIVSMVLGASGMPFSPYCIGSMLGLLPVMIPAVIAGQNIEDPLSASFLVPFAIMAALSLCSALVYAKLQKRKKKK